MAIIESRNENNGLEQTTKTGRRQRSGKIVIIDGGCVWAVHMFLSVLICNWETIDIDRHDGNLKKLNTYGEDDRQRGDRTFPLGQAVAARGDKQDRCVFEWLFE